MDQNIRIAEKQHCPLEHTPYEDCCIKADIYDKIKESDKHNCTFVEHCAKLKEHLERIL